MNRISRLLVAATVLAAALPALADGWGDSKPILHTLRATTSRPAAAATAPAPGWNLQGKAVLWSLRAPRSSPSAAGAPDAHFGQKLAIHTLVRM